MASQSRRGAQPKHCRQQRGSRVRQPSGPGQRAALKARRQHHSRAPRPVGPRGRHEGSKRRLSQGRQQGRRQAALPTRRGPACEPAGQSPPSSQRASGATRGAGSQSRGRLPPASQRTQQRQTAGGPATIRPRRLRRATRATRAPARCTCARPGAATAPAQRRQPPRAAPSAKARLQPPTLPWAALPFR